MSYHDEDVELEQEPTALPTCHADPAGPCKICGKPGQEHACMRCGQPVCMNKQNYMNDSECGGWILDWWHDSAFSEDDGNEFYCNACLKEAYPGETEALSEPVQATVPAGLADDFTLDDSDEFP